MGEVLADEVLADGDRVAAPFGLEDDRGEAEALPAGPVLLAVRGLAAGRGLADFVFDAAEDDFARPFAGALVAARRFAGPRDAVADVSRSFAIAPPRHRLYDPGLFYRPQA